MRPLPIRIALVFILLAAGLAAQYSASYQIEQGTFNSGGNPSPILTSTSYQMTLDAIGDGINATGLTSSSYGMDAGFPPDYRPPGEVLNLRFSDKTHLAWDPESSVGTYDLYWGPLTDLPSDVYGENIQCHESSAQAADPSGAPPPGGYFFLVTARNRLDEEGTLGRKSDGDPRPNPVLVCP